MLKNIMKALVLLLSSLSIVNAAGVALVNTAVLKKSEVNPLQEYVGTVTFDKKSKIASESTGKARKINFEVGKIVKRGEILVEIDYAILDAQIAAAKSTVNMNNIQVKNAKKNYLRYKALVAKKSIAQKIYDDAKLAYEIANENLLSSQAKLNELKIQKRKKVIYAPYSGMIVEKNINDKEWLNTGSTIATIVNTQEIQIIFNLPLNFINGIKRGDIYDMDIAGKVVKAKLYAAIPNGDKLTRTFPVRFKANVGDMFVFDGAQAKTKLSKNSKIEALVINRDAVINRFNMDVVFAVVNNKAVMIPVQILGFSGTNAAISGKGLVEGMDIVVKGNERVFPKMDVKVLNKTK